jgi:nucleoside-diphosphate-sugar epimerase
MKIIITGGMGLIGHNIVAKLQNEHDVVIIDNHTNYGFIPTKEIDYLVGERRKKISNYKNYLIDISQGEALNIVFDRFKPDLVIHCASFPRQKAVEADPATGAKVMCEGLTNLLEASTKNNVKRFLYISSSMVYGDFETDVTEEAKCNPIGQYGIFKYMGEKLVQDYSRRTGIEYVIIRPSAVYGELDVEDRVVSKFVLNAIRGKTLKVNGPDEVLDFTYVDDASEGIVQAALSPNTTNQIYNITRSADRLWTLQDAAKLAIDIAGSGDLIVGPRDLSFPKRGRLSIEKAIEDFGYSPKVNVEDGFRKYYDWLKNSSYYIGNK